MYPNKALLKSIYTDKHGVQYNINFYVLQKNHGNIRNQIQMSFLAIWNNTTNSVNENPQAKAGSL